MAASSKDKKTIALKNVLEAWNTLPEGYYSASQIQKFLLKMAEVMKTVRAAIEEKPEK